MKLAPKLELVLQLQKRLVLGSHFGLALALQLGEQLVEPLALAKPSVSVLQLASE